MFKATKLKRLAFFLTFDIAIFAASFYLAYLLRFSGVLPAIGATWRTSADLVGS